MCKKYNVLYFLAVTMYTLKLYIISILLYTTAYFCAIISDEFGGL